MTHDEPSSNDASPLIPFAGFSSRQLTTGFIKRLLSRWYWLDNHANDLTDRDKAALTKLYALLSVLPENDVSALAARFYHAKPITATQMAHEQGCSLNTFLNSEARILVKMAAASQQARPVKSERTGEIGISK